jgi:excisionase family DNA binding protein
MSEQQKEILNVEEACQLLGISSKTFSKILKEGDIPGRKIGREWKFSRQALIDWVGNARARDFLYKKKKKGPARAEERRPRTPQTVVRPARPKVSDSFSIEED